MVDGLTISPCVVCSTFGAIWQTYLNILYILSKQNNSSVATGQEDSIGF
jgi:hypothetical protein